jgi:glutathione S-transferase
LIEFYTNPRSRGAMVQWMLEELGQPYTTHVLDYGTTMKAPEYLAINPMGKVPAIRHDGQVVTEVAAIIAYLADTFPEAGLGPTPQERAAYLRWLFFAAGPVEAAVTNQALGVEIPADRKGMVGYGSFDAVIAVLEARLTESPYIAGARFTAADVYVGSQIGWGMMFKTMPERPAFVAYWDRLKDRPARHKATIN